MKKWIRKKFQKWLGIDDLYMEIRRLDRLYSDLVTIGVDVHVHPKNPHNVWIFTPLKGGQLRHTEVHFKNLSELEELVKELKARYRTEHVFLDAPRGFPADFAS